MKMQNGKYQMSKNLIMNVLAFGVQFIISFYISPKIVGAVGTSAYGFIGLANDFVAYATIITSVFNSVASRFIANAFYQNDIEKANHYFNSLIAANLIMASVFGAVGLVLVPNLDGILSIEAGMIFDVKLTFALVFASYIVTLVTQVFTTSTFVTNRTDIQGIRNIIQHIVRFACVVLFLNFISVRIYWVSMAALIAATVVAVMNVGLTKKLTPELKINIKYAKVSYAKELAKSGCWMALTTISTILLRGLDLTIANVMLGDYEMGILSIARTMPNTVTSIINTIAPLFTPVFIAFFAKNQILGLVENVKQTIEKMAIIMFVPITGFIVFSFDFYSLWQKSLTKEEIFLFTMLSTITVIQAYFNSVTATMAQISVVVNKLVLPVCVSVGCGVLSILIDFALLLFTDIGLYAIVISPTIVMVLRYVIFNSIYAAYCLKQKKTCFLPRVIRTWLSVPLLLGTMFLVRFLRPADSWMWLAVDVLLCAVIGYAEMAVLFDRKKIKKILCKIKKK